MPHHNSTTDTMGQEGLALDLRLLALLGFLWLCHFLSVTWSWTPMNREHCDLCDLVIKHSELGELLHCDYALPDLGTVIVPLKVRLTIYRNAQETMPMHLCKSCRTIILSR